MLPIIIIVDDEVSNYYTLEKAVQEKTGCITFHACSSRCFFKLIKSVVPDFIFMKAVMPGPDAMYCLKKIRSIKQYNSVPVITYSTGVDYKKEAYKNRANLYLTKPESFVKVCDAVNSILSFDWKSNLYPPDDSLVV